jgi:RNA polymerase sigma-70 factor, ECF subfamily
MQAHGTPPPESSDESLLAAIAQGDVAAFEALYARHWRMLLGYLIGQVGSEMLAEDVLQTVMLAVWQGAGNFRGESSVRTWLIAIARHHVLRIRQRERTPDPLPDDVQTSDPAPPDIAAQHATAATIRAALDNLPAAQRETLELVFFHGLTGPEVAAVMGVALGTVKSRLRRAKTALQRLLRYQEISDA